MHVALPEEIQELIFRQHTTLGNIYLIKPAYSSGKSRITITSHGCMPQSSGSLLKHGRSNHQAINKTHPAQSFSVSSHLEEVVASQEARLLLVEQCKNLHIFIWHRTVAPPVAAPSSSLGVGQAPSCVTAFSCLSDEDFAAIRSGKTEEVTFDVP